MSLRVRLVLLSLLTLVLPWAGCEYARQMEAVLRKGQEQSLLTTAGVLQSAIAGDAPLVESSFIPSKPDQLFAAQLLTYPLLDGFGHEWPQPSRALPGAAQEHSLRLGIYGAALYVFMHVVDSQVVYESPSDGEETAPPMDRILLLTRDITEVQHAWSLSAVAPGPIIVRTAATSAPWRAAADQDDEIRGVWRAASDGYDVELRVPLRLLGSELAIGPLDQIAPAPDTTLRSFRVASELLRDRLQAYAPPGVRISVVDTQGWLLARAGSLLRPDQTEIGNEDDLPNFYRWLLARDDHAAPAYGLPYGMWGSPVDEARSGRASANWFSAAAGEPATVRAAVPITRNGIPIGALIAEQAGELLLRERDTALAGLLRLALFATVAAIVLTLAFAAWMQRRIRRLSVAAVNALSPEGRIEQQLPDMEARDELGDLARSFASLLYRINEYAGYLQTLGSKLSHEFRTPLAIVSSSLENLAADKEQSATQSQFIERARDGTTRLQTILSAMTEATRVEQSIEHAEQVDFDLAELVRSTANAYQQTFTKHRIEASAPVSAPMHGAPELIVQMLDKLIDNAVDFCPAQGLIHIGLTDAGKHYSLSVSNEGPLLPPDAERKIFDMLFGSRTASSSKPHLGLGLYIVQLIARFHRGEALARNLADGTGVEFELSLRK
jgi:dedicated sortase system histidine kinase